MTNNKPYVLLNWYEGQLEAFSFIEEGVDSMIVALFEEGDGAIGKLLDSHCDLIPTLENMSENGIEFSKDYDMAIEGAYNLKERLSEFLS